MNLHEYQAKELLKDNGIKVPKSKLSKNIDALDQIARGSLGN